MAIQVLSQETIDKIAAGEVIERPASVVKELVENAIDAKATAITVEIKDGGTSFIRITDNGCGISKEEIALAFLRHSTSKITSAKDLATIATLGFRGEALSSISAVAQVELLTKTRDSFTGVRYCIEGGREKSLEEVGTPDGTTFLVRNLFYNTPARKKFLKTNTTEGNYIQDLMERLALSHPEISFKLISNNQPKLHTSGNTNLKDIIYQIYGRDIAANVIPVDFESDEVKLTGFIGKPVVSRGNRQYENYFINGRYVKSSIVSKAIEQGYKNFMMQHKYPFTVLHVHFKGEELDVNVHPTKMELRFSNGEKVYQLFYHVISDALKRNEMIPDVEFGTTKRAEPKASEIKASDSKAPGTKTLYSATSAVKMPGKPLVRPAESFEKNRIAKEQADAKKQAVANEQSIAGKQDVTKESLGEKQQSVTKPLIPSREKSEGTKLLDNLQSVVGRIRSKEREDVNHLQASLHAGVQGNVNKADTNKESTNHADMVKETTPYKADGAKGKTEPQSEPQSNSQAKPQTKPQQMTLFEEQVIERRVEDEIQIIGQVFDTYWILQFEDKMFLVDQHAAHEKVLYERTMAQLKTKQFTSQVISPPLIVTLSGKETELLEKYRSEFEQLGFEMEAFGGKEYAINAVPANMFNLQAKELFLEMLDDLSDEIGKTKPDMILDKIASMSCKAAIKGNQHISRQEAEQLLKELMTLENPYNCPHGRPVLISMSKYELEKKFKRIV